MRSKKILGLTFLAMLMLPTIPAVLASCVPGRSPGYWKHQCKVYINGRGHMHENILALCSILGISVQDAYDIFTTGSPSERVDLANDFNALKGWLPYVDDD